MTKKKKSSFRGRVKSNASRQSTGNTNNYLKLPKDMKLYIPTPGKTEKFDVIPYKVSIKNHPDLHEGFPTVGDNWYRFPFKTHKDVGADNETVICPKTFKDPCPVCEHKTERSKAGAEQDELKGYYAKDRDLFAIIPKAHKKLDEEVHIMDMSWWLFQKYLNKEFEENEDYELFPDLEEGYTLRVRWSEETFQKSTYAEAGRIDFDPRKKPYKESILKEVPCLEKILHVLSYDELTAKFHEMESEDEDEKETKKSKRKKKSNKKKKDKKKVELTWDDITDMGLPELSEVIDSNSLDVNSEDYEDVQELQEEVAKELGIELPKKKSAKKKTTSKKKDKKEGKETCPEGFKYGKDTDEAKTRGKCDKCNLWDDCVKKQEE